MDAVQGAPDVGEWLVEDVTAWWNGFLDTDRLLAIAWRLGAATADLHTALAGSRRSTVGARSYFVAATSALHDATAMVDGDAGDRLRGARDEVLAALEPLRSDRLLPAQRVHGDLTVARFHAVESDLLVEPPEPIESFAPELPQSPLTDLAALLQSVDHAGRIAVQRAQRDAGDREARLDALLLDAVLQAYTAVHAVDLPVLHALRVWAELRTFAWAASGRAEWMWLPDATLPVVLARGAR